MLTKASQVLVMGLRAPKDSITGSMAKASFAGRNPTQMGQISMIGEWGNWDFEAIGS